ncbi:MAG: nucleotide exchange factor GrpE [Candidatus Tyrphobacter sp.]
MFEEERLEPPAPDGSSEAQALAELREQLSAANARADENYNRFLVAAADFENFKKRTERDLRKMLDERRKTLLLRFLPVLDNLERALESGGDDRALRNGLEQTVRGFRAVLHAEGLRPVDVENKPFDPRLAEAIETTQASDDVEDDTVVAVAERGYTLDDELLRPAKVTVAKREV